MLIRKPDALMPSDRTEAMSRPTNGACRNSSFEVFRNGVLDHVINGTEGFVRNRLSTLYNLHPEDSWDFAPIGDPYAVAAE